MTTILEALTTPMTAKALASTLGKSESRTRELLKPLIADGSVVATGKPAVYSVPAPVEATPATDKPKKVLLNPQPKINAMIEEAAAFGCTLAYSKNTRKWTLAGPIQAEWSAVELAAVREAGFEGFLTKQSRKAK